MLWTSIKGDCNTNGIYRPRDLMVAVNNIILVNVIYLALCHADGENFSES